MYITAHGGALNTGRNSEQYFAALESKKIDADIMEVDIWGNEKLLYLSHNPAPFKKNKCLTLEQAFLLAKKLDIFINCDIKPSSIFVAVRNLAFSVGAERNLLFTGSTKPEHIKDLVVGQVYANNSFFRSAGLKFKAGSAKAIKDYIASFKNDRLKGININYKLVDDAFLADCEKHDLRLSVYTVDDEQNLEKFLKLSVVDNITTNIPNTAKKLEKELKNKQNN